jgi:signal transduction histidine kinase
MIARLKQTQADWALCGLMLALCAVLSVLQYRWTGQIADAEVRRLRSNLDEQSRALAHAFDAELRSACSQLVPEGPRFPDDDLAGVLLARFKTWKAGNYRPVFSRIAMAVSDENGIQLSLLNQTSGQWVGTNWPGAWSALEDNLARKMTGPAPPFNDECGMLLELPVFGGPPDAAPGQPMKWIILELDSNYVRNVWLPECVAKYLNPSSQSIQQIIVRSADRSPDVLYALQTNVTGTGAPDVSVPLNSTGRMPRGPRGPPPGAGHWLLMIWQRPGALEAIVAASRLRNLAVAVAINLMMFTTGIALIHYTRRARQLAEQQMNFVSNVSHELRTPLTVIRGAAHNMQRGVVKERSQIEEYCGLIIQHTEQLTAMIEQLLELGGVEKNHAALARQTVALSQVLKDAVTAGEHDTRSAGCRVELEIPDTLPPVCGDAPALRRVFENLITNAAKHGGPGGWIGVKASAVNGDGPATVEVRVSDRGPGIPADEQAKIFEPFFRGAAARGRQIRGSGLGLSLVREIVALHHGEISVSSQEGKGATFIVRLPAADMQPGQTP